MIFFLAGKDMNRISELKGILGKNFDWNKARLDCFVRMLLALFTVRTVNLSEIAVAFCSKATIESRYKRIRRFFSQYTMNFEQLAKWIFCSFSLTDTVYLTIDRTNWFWGKAKINILTLGIAYEGVAIPLLWDLLNKAGNALATEHQSIIQRFVKLFVVKRIAGLLADREFASGHLFSWCNEQKIPFYIRIKDNAAVRMGNKKFCNVKKLFKHLNPKEQTFYPMTVEIFGAIVYLAGSRSERGELMVIATNQSPKNAIAIYLRRWEIENLFSCLKGRGFCFEDTHLTYKERIEKLMGLLAVGFCWAHKTGEWRADKKPIKMNKHRDGRRLQNSFFRYGLDFIRAIIINHVGQGKALRDCMRLLSPSPPHLELIL
jgi:hypothetical protein